MARARSLGAVIGVAPSLRAMQRGCAVTWGRQIGPVLVLAGGMVLFALLLAGLLEMEESPPFAQPPWFYWPSEVRDVPRTVRPLVVQLNGPSAPSLFVEIYDAGPVSPTDVLTEGGWKDWGRPIPADARRVRMVPQRVKTADNRLVVYEYVPVEGPLAPNHRFFFATGGRITAAFATGAATDSGYVPTPVRLVPERIGAPLIGDDRMCARESASAVFRTEGPRTLPRLLAAWTSGEGRDPPEAFVVVREGEVDLGRKYGRCRDHGLGLVLNESGPKTVLFREWLPGGLGPVVRVSFDVPVAARKIEAPARIERPLEAGGFGERSAER